MTPQTRILIDAAAGQLAAASWVVPDFQDIDHSPVAVDPHSVEHPMPDRGPQWVASIVDAIGRSTLWSSTAIVVVWDDWGGYYDHVAPPARDHVSQHRYGLPMPELVPRTYYTLTTTGSRSPCASSFTTTTRAP